MLPTSFRCRGAWRVQKRSSESDLWLEEMGFFRKHTARDPSCLFRIVSENIYNTQRYFHKVRLDCIKFMASKRHLFEGSITCSFDDYLKEMSNPSGWGGFIEISAMSNLYRCDFVIFEANNDSQTKVGNGYGKTIYLFYSSDTKHFDAVYTKDYISLSSFCQSLMYEILYAGVFKLKELPYAVGKMLHDKNASNHIDYLMSEKKQKDRAKIFIESPTDDSKDKNNNVKVALKCRHRTEDIERAGLLRESLSIFVYNRNLIELQNICFQCLDVNSAKDLLDNGITPFPYKVAKALDPDIYRNIEFDVWSEIRRELRYGARFSDGRTLQVGVKCLVRLQEDQSIPYHCHIQEMRPDGGPCLVFIEELGEKRVVNYEQLESLPQDEIRPWAPPYRYSRAHSQYLSLSQMLQQLGNITRKQGLSKIRNKIKSNNEEFNMSDSKMGSVKKQNTLKLPWKNDCLAMNTEEEEAQINEFSYGSYLAPNMINFSAYNHLDFINFQTIPGEITALPLMVDIRPIGVPAGSEATPPQNGPAPSTLPAPTSNSQPTASNAENMHNQGASGDMGAHGMTSPASVRASTPAAGGTLASYTPNYAGGMNMGGYGMNMGMPVNVSYPPPGPYMFGSVKGGVLWCPPPAAPAHHPPPGVNPHVYKSVQPNGSDLPMNDIQTLRYFFNLGVDCMWSGCAPAGPPHTARYAPADIVQDMQQMSLHDRHGPTNHNGPDFNQKGGGHKPMGHGMAEKPNMGGQGKGNGQRPLLGPRFKRGGNGQDGLQGAQNKGHNNGLSNNRPNNRTIIFASRRNSHVDGRNNQGYQGGPGAGAPVAAAATSGAGEGECAPMEPMMPYSYMPYPPPVYPMPYYQLETDPGMLSVMGGMNNYIYEESCEYVPPPAPYYPPPYPPPASVPVPGAAPVSTSGPAAHNPPSAGQPNDHK